MAKVVVSLDLDFSVLRDLKSNLLTSLWDHDDDPLWGLVNLIDEIQDQAVDKNGVSEKEVFGKSLEKSFE